MRIETIKHCKLEDGECSKCPAMKDIYICNNVNRMDEEFAEMLVKEIENEKEEIYLKPKSKKTINVKLKFNHLGKLKSRICPDEWEDDGE